MAKQGNSSAAGKAAETNDAAGAAGAGGEGNDNGGEAAAAAATAAAAAAGAAAGTGAIFTQADFDAKLNKEIARRQKKADEQKEMSETEKLKADLADRDKQLNLVKTESAFTQAAGLPAVKAARLFQLYQSDIEFDAAGKPTNLQTVIKQAKTDYPELWPKTVEGSGDGARKPAEGPNVSMNDFLRRK